MDRKWTIRPVREQDFEDITVAESAIGPEPVSERETREWHDLSLKDTACPTEWLVAVEDDGSTNGRFLGFGEWGKAHWIALDEREIHVSVPPARRGMGVGTYLLNHLEALARRESPKALYAWGRGYDRDSLKWAQNRGYVIERERTESVLDLETFDAVPFQADLDRVALAGIEVITVHSAGAEPYFPQLYRVETETFRDVPFRSPDTPDTTYEAFLLEYKHTKADKVFALALQGGEVVGLSCVWMPRSEGQSAGISYTGVLKPHRGKGVAFAVKVASVVEARRCGAKRIRTNNDPDNPAILKLNQRLGFRPVPGPIILKKSLAQ